MTEPQHPVSIRPHAVDVPTNAAHRVQLPNAHLSFRKTGTPCTFWSLAPSPIELNKSMLAGEPVFVTADQKGKPAVFVSGTEPTTISSTAGTYVECNLELSASFVSTESDEQAKATLKAVTAFKRALKKFFAPSVDSPTFAHIRKAGESVSTDAVHFDGKVWYPVRCLLSAYHENIGNTIPHLDLISSAKLSALANGTCSPYPGGALGERWEAFFAVDFLPLDATRSLITPEGLSETTKNDDLRLAGKPPVPASASAAIVITQGVTSTAVPGVNWSYPYRFPFNANQASVGGAPAATVHKDRLYLMWVQGNQSLMFGSSSDGISWGTAIQCIDVDTKAALGAALAGPGIVEVKGSLHALFPIADKTLAHYVFNDNDNSPAWKKQSWNLQAPGSTTFPPAVTMFDDIMFCVWVLAGTQNLCWAVWVPFETSTDSLGSSPGIWCPALNPIPNAHSAGAPGLTVINKQVYLMFTDTSNTINELVYEPGTTLLNGSWKAASFPVGDKSNPKNGISCDATDTVGMVAFVPPNSQTINVCFWTNGTWNTVESVQITSGIPTIVAFNGAAYLFHFVLAALFPVGVFVYNSRPLTHLVYPKSWMKNFTNPNRSLTTMTIPGTHDSGTYNAPFYKVWAGIQTQTMSITQQLTAGVRFFDIRLGLDGQTIALFHGGYTVDLDLDDVLQAMYNFLQTQPGETILFMTKCDDNNTDDVQLWTAVNKVISNSSWWYTGKDLPLLKNARGKIVLLRRFQVTYPPAFGIDLSGYQNASEGVYWPVYKDANGTVTLGIDEQDCYAVEPFADPPKDQKWAWIYNSLQRSIVEYGKTKMNSTTLFLNFSNASQYGPVMPPDFFAYSSWDEGEGENERLLDFFSNTTPDAGAHGVIAMDFPEYPKGQLLPAVINQNDFSQ